MLNSILFFVFAAIALTSSILMITRRNAVIAALFLVLNFAVLAGIYLLLNAQFIAVIQIIVYAGAIMVLFLFVIMLLRPERERKFFSENPRIKTFAILIGAFVFLQLVYVIFIGKSTIPISGSNELSVQAGTVETIGNELYTKYVIPIQAAGFILLAAAIGAMVLAKKKFE